MVRYDEALAIFSQFGSSPEFEDIAIADAIGRVLSETLVAREASPPFDNSAMDGFAVSSARLSLAARENPIELKAQGCLAAGDAPTGFYSADRAVEIMTGAVLPSDVYDAVVKIEDVEVKRGPDGRALSVRFHGPAKAGENVRRRGEDFKDGQTVLEKGARIEPQHLLAMTTLGWGRVRVAKAPRFAILSTGNELVPYDTRVLKPGQIRNSTALYLEAYLRARGFPLRNLGSIGDTVGAFKRTVTQAFEEGADILISTGAVSMGQFDFVRPALEEMGARIHFHKCAIRPGKPILFASLEAGGRKRFIFGVPGNPVSTAVGLRFFVLPFVACLLGARNEVVRRMPLAEDVGKPEGLKCFFKAETMLTEEAAKVRALKGQASFMVSPLLKANAWVVLPERGILAEAGMMVEVFDL